jgi:hypothetical protein
VRSYAQQQPTTVAEDEMPLIWPILTPAELAQGMAAPKSPLSISQLVAAFVTVLDSLLFWCRRFCGLLGPASAIGLKIAAERTQRPPEI